MCALRRHAVCQRRRVDTHFNSQAPGPASNTRKTWREGSSETKETSFCRRMKTAGRRRPVPCALASSSGNPTTTRSRFRPSCSMSPGPCRHTTLSSAAQHRRLAPIDITCLALASSNCNPNGVRTSRIRSNRPMPAASGSPPAGLLRRPNFRRRVDSLRLAARLRHRPRQRRALPTTEQPDHRANCARSLFCNDDRQKPKTLILLLRPGRSELQQRASTPSQRCNHAPGRSRATQNRVGQKE